jgi:hypothetical protein
MIRHTVVLRLRHAAGSPEEAKFLTDGTSSAQAPGPAVAM